MIAIPAFSATTPRAESAIRQAVRRIGRSLPHQAPIRDFVSQNKLLAFQHLPFEQALEASEKATGNHAYLPESEFRAFFASGRISETDLQAVFDRQEARADPSPLAVIGERVIHVRDVVRIALLFGIEPIRPYELAWRIRDEACFAAFQADVPAQARERMLSISKDEEPLSEARIVSELWNACLQQFGLGHLVLHPEELTDLSRQQAETILARFNQHTADSCRVEPGIHSLMRAEERVHLRRFFSDTGESATFRDILLKLTGRDLLEDVRPTLIRITAAHLDEGLAIWAKPNREQGLYAAWRGGEQAGFLRDIAGLSAYHAARQQLPEDAEEAVVYLLDQLNIPEKQREAYLHRLAWETPGWAGMVNWRAEHPAYAANRSAPTALMDFLAIRLFLDRLWIERFCRETWNIRGGLNSLRAYFEQNVSEFFVRHQLYAGELPEYLIASAQSLIGLAWSERQHRENWRILADMTWTWQHSLAANPVRRHTVFRSAWRLFRLAQHLGINSEELRALPRKTAETLLSTLDAWTPNRKAYLWLQAYEHHYRETLFNALTRNLSPKPSKEPVPRPEAQVIFCMDDREEGMRRHLEELSPAVETFGAAGFFGVAMHWQGIDDSEGSALCPLTVTPAHEVHEIPSNESDPAWRRRRRGLGWARRVKSLSSLTTRRNLLFSPLLTVGLAPAALLNLAGRILLPWTHDSLRRGLTETWLAQPDTRLTLHAKFGAAPASPQSPRLGFTETEQVDRVEGLLRTIGLTTSFAPLVVLAGHGSSSRNNPHAAAYDCGACSGRHGGPNARVFAAMANDPRVRARLAARGLTIPQDTWFIGTEHNTTNEEVLWFDLMDMPTVFKASQQRVAAQMNEAARHSAHERCRRFASAPSNLSPLQALRHVIGRSADIAQSRPELGHATNAAAVVGRRTVTQGVFFDRRMFLISYDPLNDPGGKILEKTLLAAGPVGAGINLEYFFSKVNNAAFGASSKTQHNVTGLFGVMEGAASDLRTGFPWQMIELHEPMRLQLVVEAEVEVLQAIYERQPALRELIGNQWLLLSAIHPISGEITVFDPQRGFRPWMPVGDSLPEVARSSDWYAGHTAPLPPAFTGRARVYQEPRHAA